MCVGVWVCVDVCVGGGRGRVICLVRVAGGRGQVDQQPQPAAGAARHQQEHPAGACLEKRQECAWKNRRDWFRAL
jgi:hypothetical protein